MLRIIPILIVLLINSCSIVDKIQYGENAVDLSREHLEVLPESLFLKKETKILRLYGNDLDSLSYRIGELENLEELYIGRNNLKSLPKEIGQLKKLRILSIQYNEIETIPAEIGQLINLEQLILNQNKIKSLPSEIGKLEKLQVLQLKYNQLSELPTELAACQNLQFLYLTRNNLTVLPPALGTLSHLKELYLYGAGQLLEIPETFCDLRLLEVLEIDQTTVVPTCLLVKQTNRLTIIQKP